MKTITFELNPYFSKESDNTNTKILKQRELILKLLEASGVTSSLLDKRGIKSRMNDILSSTYAVNEIFNKTEFTIDGVSLNEDDENTPCGKSLKQSKAEFINLAEINESLDDKHFNPTDKKNIISAIGGNKVAKLIKVGLLEEFTNKEDSRASDIQTAAFLGKQGLFDGVIETDQYDRAKKIIKFLVSLPDDRSKEKELMNQGEEFYRFLLSKEDPVLYLKTLLMTEDTKTKKTMNKEEYGQKAKQTAQKMIETNVKNEDFEFHKFIEDTFDIESITEEYAKKIINTSRRRDSKKIRAFIIDFLKVV